METNRSWPCYRQAPMNPNLESYVRVLHASPDAPAVDIYANGNMIASNLKYKQITEYVPVPQGTYKIQVFPAGQRETAVIDTMLTVPPQMSFTLAAINKLSDIGLMPISEPYMPMIDKRSSYVRFAHLSPNAPSVDISLPDGTNLFNNISYKEYTEYLPVNPGTYTLLVHPAGSKETVLTVPNVKLSPGTIYTVYAVGLVNGNPPLDALLITDGNY